MKLIEGAVAREGREAALFPSPSPPFLFLQLSRHITSVYSAEQNMPFLQCSPTGMQLYFVLLAPALAEDCCAAAMPPHRSCYAT